MRTKRINATLRRELEEESIQWLGSCADDAFIAGAEWIWKKMMKDEPKGMPREKTAYINGQGVETR